MKDRGPTDAGAVGRFGGTLALGVIYPLSKGIQNAFRVSLAFLESLLYLQAFNMFFRYLTCYQLLCFYGRASDASSSMAIQI